MADRPEIPGGGANDTIKPPYLPNLFALLTLSSAAHSHYLYHLAHPISRMGISRKLPPPCE